MSVHVPLPSVKVAQSLHVPIAPQPTISGTRPSHIPEAWTQNPHDMGPRLCTLSAVQPNTIKEMLPVVSPTTPRRSSSAPPDAKSSPTASASPDAKSSPMSSASPDAKSSPMCVPSTVAKCVMADIEVLKRPVANDAKVPEKRIPAGDSESGHTSYNLEDARARDADNMAQHEVFAWLKWSPAPGSACYDALHKYFPGAVPGEVVHARTKILLESPRFSFSATNTILGTSICPDEINSVSGTMVDLMKRNWGGMSFPMGGISGAPFSGKTGFAAFSHHVPNDGNVFVVFGPHVSISEEGEVSKCFRRGIEKKSTACGAVVGAYNACIGGGVVDNADFDMKDMQMSWIKSQIAPHADRIKLCENPMAELAHLAYDFVKDMMMQVVNTNFGEGHLAVLGGIMINMPEGYSDHFLPLMFQINKKDEVPQDLMNIFKTRVTAEVMKDEVQVQGCINLYARMLKQVDLFSDVSEDQLVHIARSMVRLTFYDGEYIVEQGDEGNTFYVLLSGTAACTVNGAEVKRYQGCVSDTRDGTILKLLEGSSMKVDYFGEIGFKGSKRAASIRVVSSKAEVLAISRDVFELVTMPISRRASFVADSQQQMQTLRAKDFHQATHHYVFSWLNWSPQPDSACYRQLHDQFPCAIPGPALFSRIILALQQFGLTPSDTIFGTSLCPDEINSRLGELVEQMKDYWGENFPLGGISGAPFAGKTGFTAFSHHVPDNGNVIVLFGPHVGISADGEVGKFLRAGQDKCSVACGAAVGAYNSCIASNSIDPEFDKADMQMAWFKQQIAPHAQRIQKQENPMAALAHQAYKIVEDEVAAVVSNEFGDGLLVLIGVIQINMPEPYFDHFLPVKFEVRSKRESYDMMQWLAPPEFLQESKASRDSLPYPATHA